MQKIQYVRIKRNSEWLKRIKDAGFIADHHTVFIFPYFIDNNNNHIGHMGSGGTLVSNDSSSFDELERFFHNWSNLLTAITKRQFLKLSKFNKKNLDLIVDLFKSKDEANKIIAIELYKQENMKNQKTTKRMYVNVAPGVHQETKGKYRVRKTVKGRTTSATFTNKQKAIKYYKSL